MSVLNNITGKAYRLHSNALFRFAREWPATSHHLVFVINPETNKAIEKELDAMSWNQGSVLADTAGQINLPVKATMFGHDLIIDEAIPPGEVELRQIIERSWEK